MIHTWHTSDLKLDVDAVLRGLGADASLMRQRRPMLVEVAQKALDIGRPLLQPKAFHCKLEVKTIRHQKIHLEGDHHLCGKLVAEHLAPAEYVVVMLFTVGENLEALVNSTLNQDMLLGMALDGVGSAGVEALANAACRHFERRAAGHGYQASIPLSPGMIGWPVAEGQRQIFSILDDQQINVILTENSLMLPRKSLSMVQGFGLDMKLTGRICDLCSMRETCRYQEHNKNPHAD